MRCLSSLLLLAGLALAGSGCALLPISPYTCADACCGCVPAGPLWASSPSAARTAPVGGPPPMRARGAGAGMSY